MEYFRSWSKLVLGINLAYLLVLGLLVKALISDISYATFLITIPVLAFEGYKLYIKSKKPDPIALQGDVKKELDQIKSKLSALTMEKGVKAQPTRYF